MSFLNKNKNLCSERHYNIKLTAEKNNSVNIVIKGSVISASIVNLYCFFADKIQYKSVEKTMKVKGIKKIHVNFHINIANSPTSKLIFNPLLSRYYFIFVMYFFSSS